MISLYRLLCIGLLVNVGQCLNVLVFFPYPGKSHTILGEGYVRHLVKAGHNVTYVTPIPIKNLAPNLRQIDVSSNFQHFKLVLDIQKILNHEVDITNEYLVYSELHNIAEVAIKHEKVQNLLLDTSEKFDVAIVEWLYSDLYAGVPAVFNCPFIWSSSIEPHPMVLRLIDDIPNPAYLPDHMSAIDPPLSFTQRVGELWHYLKLFQVRWTLCDKETAAWKEAYGPAFVKRGRVTPSPDDVKYQGSLMLGNSHVSSGMAIRLPQNYIPIAGYHFDNNLPTLPEDIKNIMDSASHGVIYFSLGTMMKGKTMPDELKNGFINTFKELKQTVIWKLEQQLPNLPENVHIVQWAPQQSILAHPNLVLFITHGGLLSTTEALHYGVPMIGIPLFADQFINIERAVNKGFAIRVKIGYNTPVELKAAIREVLGNSSYKKKVHELSAVYHDRPVSPGDELVHWVAHVAKTQGAPHLRSPALLLPWYQKMYLDLLLLIIISTLITVTTIKYLLTSLFKNEKIKRN